MKEKLLALGAKKLIVGGALAAVLLGGLGVAAETGVFTGGTASPSPTASSTASPSASEALPDANAGGKNVVQVINRTDNNLKVDGRVQFNRINAPNAGPANLAMAYSQCAHCQTYAVALQINLISTSSNNVQPQNAATAANVQCDGCLTISRAIQYNISVDDPTNVPPEVNRLVAQMKAELAQVKASSSTVSEADARFDAVIAQFRTLANYLKDSRQEQTAPTTPGATPMPSGTTEPTSTATPTETPSVSPTAS
jgi:hypothetical protein